MTSTWRSRRSYAWICLSRVTMDIGTVRAHVCLPQPSPGPPSTDGPSGTVERHPLEALTPIRMARPQPRKELLFKASLR